MSEQDHRINYPLYYQDLIPIKEENERTLRTLVKMMDQIEEIYDRLKKIEKKLEIRTQKEDWDRL
jgi:hypothetical protein